MCNSGHGATRGKIIIAIMIIYHTILINQQKKDTGMKKLLITLGPASLAPATITELVQYQPYVFRLNMSHVSLDDLARHIKTIQSCCDIPVCIDSEGAQVRTHAMENGAVELREGATVALLSEPAPGSAQAFSLTPFGIVAQFREGDIVRLDWHGATIRITGSGREKAEGEVVVPGVVASCKAVDVNRALTMPAITDKDAEAIRIGREYGVRHYALSFAGSGEDVRAFRRLTGAGSRIISKLESESAIRNLAEILGETDEALIDRGDLSRAVQVEKIPFLQMRMIATARALDTPIFVATNLLETMIESGQPSRAEVNDVVSTINMGANGLVLAAESAVGKHPVQCAATIRTLMRFCEKWTANSTIDDILAM